MVNSNSSAALPATSKIRELFGLIAYQAKALSHNGTAGILRICDEYDAILTRYSGLRLTQAKTFEIGFGTRAGIMIALTSLGVDAYGVDLDVPLLGGSPADLLEMYRKNGLERAAKSAIRFVLFDFFWKASLAKNLARRGAKVIMPARSRLLVRDAASVDWPDRSFDLITSESVFEHIPVPSLEILVAKMSRWLKRGGLALIRPDVFTGISGAHLLEWFDLNPRRRRKSEPWEHLRKKRYRGNVYLNELHRKDYRRLFSSHFEILEESVLYPDQGREFFSPEVARDLASYDEGELFSNGVMFVLRPKSSGSHG
ncbi:MAG: methyltransferase domain-containing protein [Deltaproteobacteria bacterium]|nr:methyltransferase domain-containing protein [Deltaproteobacteria bacterium]